MELKFVIYFDTYLAEAVLIVPLWNWNISAEEPGTGIESFNRTFMELKSLISAWVQTS